MSHLPLEDQNVDSSEDLAHPDSRVVRSFDRSMISKVLDQMKMHYLTDSDGDFWLNFAYDPAIDGKVQIYLGAEGDGGDILACRGEISRTFELDRFDEILRACNRWNEEKRWPKAFVVTDQAKRLAVFIESQYGFRQGVFQAMVEDMITVFISGTHQFWKTEGTSKAFSKRSKTSSKRESASQQGGS